jgi:hypothetical protein
MLQRLFLAVSHGIERCCTHAGRLRRMGRIEAAFANDISALAA